MIHMLQFPVWPMLWPLIWPFAWAKPHQKTPPSLDDPDLEGIFGYYTP
ncbi:hypothetical protein LSUCC1028_06100 [Rhodobacterales bacterium LSUCC1028]|jgi:hypothetical protein|nr:hypothetical protein [Rhodobacterales bacterium FZCC0069]MBF9027149.1 hypothetical protein [Rhodobacterales bacterium FZCC0188]MBF9053807.1 hypothetical protein [Rhodobacterales bacterium LSUCC1028]